MLPTNLLPTVFCMRGLSLFCAASSRGAARRLRLMSTNSREKILAESWSAVSQEYEKVLVPRFAPWEERTLGALRNAVNSNLVNDGTPHTALVLCCGPGHELLPIAKMLGPTSRVLGSDLASGMIDVARQRVEEECNDDGENAMYKECISTEICDAMNPPAGPYHVVYCSFGLQQLPDPMEAVHNWIRVMHPGGICVIIYWPPDPPKMHGVCDDPFSLWGQLVRKKLGKGDNGDSWDENIDATVAEAGGEIVDMKYVTHDIHWKDARHLFDGMSQAGPWHAMRLRRGDHFVDELGEELVSMYPRGECLCHKVTARLVIARRRSSSQK